MIKLIIAALAGLAGHSFSRVIDGWEQADLPVAWARVARYIIGVGVALPVFILIRRGNNYLSDESEKDIQAYVVAFVGTGVGVAIGYLSDELK